VIRKVTLSPAALFMGRPHVISRNKNPVYGITIPRAIVEQLGEKNLNKVLYVAIALEDSEIRVNVKPEEKEG